MFFVLVVLRVASSRAIIMNSGHEAVFVSPLSTKYIRNVFTERERVEKYKVQEKKTRSRFPRSLSDEKRTAVETHSVGSETP